ncbi:hypothetical protein HAX54_032179 [Datura stramonium]|uniref:Uncharacterized protein n=1 Tax=Datura stramonium TaxID=4076 RepID=A0ABS8VB82_DATST|nr:hypothetical protein [Datura stramonium]
MLIELRCCIVYGATESRTEPYIVCSTTPKGKEVIVAEKSRMRGRPRKMEASSLAPKAGPTRRFGVKAVEPHGLTWFNTQKESKYSPENWIDEGRLALEFPDIQEKICELGAGYIFTKLERCNLTLVRELYANWDTLFGESTKVKIRGQVV